MTDPAPDPTPAPAPAPTPPTPFAPEPTMSQTTTITVTGMTCQHCVAAVTDELSALAGVSAVDVDLDAGGDSAVTITSDGPLDALAVTGAVAEAGYEVAPR